MEVRKYISLKGFLRIIAGGVFIYSAVAKLISADAFELFVFGHKLFNWDIATILARLVIGFEFVLGLLLVFKFYVKKTSLVSILTLISFSVYLLYLHFFGSNTENCFCFGQEFQLPPLESVGKNIVLLILLVFVYRGAADLEFRFKKWSAIALVIIAFAVPVIVSPPDVIFLGKYAYDSYNDDGKLDVDLIKNSLEAERTLELGEGKEIICFFSTKCQFCKMASQRLSVINQRHENGIRISYVFFGEDETMEQFWEESKSDRYPWGFVPPNVFFDLSGKSLPAIFLLEDGVIKAKYGYRTIDEDYINSFFE
ncbi:MAG: DoxX family protein [Bacteroidales bacterium]|nr:DoxX family protein [Bacteroidales bacterium]